MQKRFNLSCTGFKINAQEKTEEAKPDERRVEMAKLLLKSQERRHQFNQKKKDSFLPQAQNESWNRGRQGRICLRRYHSIFQRVVDVSDILLEILDARDPQACRLRLAEKKIQSTYGSRKELVLIFNKVDLIPTPVAREWLKIFRAQGSRVIPFSSLYMKRGTTREESSFLAKGCIEQTFNVIRELQRTSTGARRFVTIGVIGFPNTGKSSIINALKRKAVVGVASRAGSTKGLTEIELRRGMRIVDSPGIVLGTSEGEGDRLVLINALPASEVKDPIAVIELIVEKLGYTALQARYKIPTVGTIQDLLKHIGIQKGRLLSGGYVDEEGTARYILQEWATGQINFYVPPPAFE